MHSHCGLECWSAKEKHKLPPWHDAPVTAACPAIQFLRAADWRKINRGKISHTRRDGVPGHERLALFGKQEALVLPTLRAMYIRNQKVGSDYLMANLPMILSNLTTTLKRELPEPLALAPDLRPCCDLTGSNVCCAQKYFRFTFVSEPVRTALRGYGEISRRHTWEELFGNVRGPMWPQPRYRNVHCSNATEVLRRLNLFLDAVQSGDALGLESFHAFPQMLKVFTHWQPLDFVGRLEALPADLERLRGRLYASQGPFLATAPLNGTNLPENTKGSSSSESSASGAPRLDLEPDEAAAHRRCSCSLRASQTHASPRTKTWTRRLSNGSVASTSWTSFAYRTQRRLRASVQPSKLSSGQRGTLAWRWRNARRGVCVARGRLTRVKVRVNVSCVR